jgi:hypothetical protein
MSPCIRTLRTHVVQDWPLASRCLGPLFQLLRVKVGGSQHASYHKNTISLNSRELVQIASSRPFLLWPRPSLQAGHGTSGCSDDRLPRRRLPFGNCPCHEHWPAGARSYLLALEVTRRVSRKPRSIFVSQSTTIRYFKAEPRPRLTTRKSNSRRAGWVRVARKA